LALFGLLAGCAPIADPSVGLPVDEAIAALDAAPRSELTAEAVAEAFALGSRATDVQRDLLQAELVGHVVEWNLPVFDVALADGRYRVTSQALPITDADAAPLLRVVAFVLPRNAADDTLLRAVKTGDVVRIRGQVQEIRLRAVVVMVPGVVTGSGDAI
jgi:hypothetical protein